MDFIYLPSVNSIYTGVLAYFPNYGFGSMNNTAVSGLFSRYWCENAVDRRRTQLFITMNARSLARNLLVTPLRALRIWVFIIVS